MKKILLILTIILFIAGTATFFYPYIVNLIYNREVSNQQMKYFENKDSSALDDLYEYMRQYNIELYENKQDKLVDPFSYSQQNVDLSKYGISDNCVGFIIIDKINITLPIYLGANTENMNKGAVHLTETSFPIGGINTNSVIAAHRGITRNMFRNIHKLNSGDTVKIKNFKETLVYEVHETKIILPDEIDKLYIQEGRDFITLISCHPLNKNYQRIVVYCERVN